MVFLKIFFYPHIIFYNGLVRFDSFYFPRRSDLDRKRTKKKVKPVAASSNRLTVRKHIDPPFKKKKIATTPTQ